jgi:Family of unknown function (DUF6262)
VLSSHPRNTDGLKAYSKQKQLQTAKKVDVAIKLLIKEKGSINFSTVSERSEVSKAYLYQHQNIRERIEALRKQQQGLPSRKHIKSDMTESSKDVLLAAKNKRIKVLEDEVKRLKEQLKRLGGKLYDNI